MNRIGRSEEVRDEASREPRENGRSVDELERPAEASLGSLQASNRTPDAVPSTRRGGPTPVSQLSLERLSAHLRAALDTTSLSSAQRTRVAERLRCVREALNADDGSLEAWRRVAHEVTTLSRAVAHPRISNRQIYDGLTELRDAVLRKTAPRFHLTLTERHGRVRDASASTPEVSRNAARIAQALLADTTLATISAAVEPHQRLAAIHIIHQLQQLTFESLAVDAPRSLDSKANPPRPHIDRQVGQDLYWTVDELFRVGSPLDPQLLSDLFKLVKEIDASAPGSALDAVADVLEVPGPVRDPLQERTGTLDPREEPSQVLFDILTAEPTQPGRSVVDVLDAYRGASQGMESASPPFARESVLPIPLLYTDNDGNAFFLPAGSRLRSDRESGLVAVTDGVLARTADTLLIAQGGELRLGRTEDGVLTERLTVATESTDMLLAGLEGTPLREGPVAVLGADRVFVDTSEDGCDSRIDLRGTSIVQTRPERLAIDADRLLYASEGVFLTDGHARIEEEAGGERSGFRDALDRLNLATKSEALSSDTIRLRTVHSAEGRHEAVFDVTGVTLESTNDDLRLAAAELRFVGSVDGRARYELQTSDLKGRLGGFDVDAQGTSSLTVEMAANGSLHTVTLSNPNTVNLSRGARRLAVTGGSFGLAYDENGSSVLDVAAIKTEYAELGADGPAARAIGVELGKLALTQSDTGAGELQVTGQVLSITYDGLNLSGGDIGLQVSLGDGGRPGSVSATGRSLTVGDGVNTVIAHEASLEIELDKRGRFSEIDHQTGTTEISSSEVGTFTLTGNSGLSLTYRGERLARVEADTEQLAFTHADGSQLDMRGAVGVIELDENAAPVRATLTTGALSWRGNDGVEISSFGAGGEVVLSPDGGVLSTGAGVEGMTVQTNGGAVQVDRGVLSAHYDEDGRFLEAVVAAKRAIYYTLSGQFDVNQGELSLTTLDDGGTRAKLQFEQVEFERGGESIFLSESNVTLLQDVAGNAELDGVFGAAAVTTERGSFTLEPGSTLRARLDADQGLNAFAGAVSRGTYRTGDDQLTIADATFDGRFADGELVSFDASGGVAYRRDGGLAIETPRAAVSLLELDDGGSRLVVSGQDLNATDRGRHFIGEGKTELGFVLNDEGEVESARARAEQFSIVDGRHRFVFDSNEVGIAEDGDIHLIKGGITLFEDGEKIGELTGTNALVDFDDAGQLAQVDLLNRNAHVTGDFGTLRAVENTGRAIFANGQLTEVDVSNGALDLSLSGGLAVRLERSCGTLNYDENRDPTLTIASGRGLIQGDFGRVTLPEGFWLRARQHGGTVFLDGATPNATLARDSGLLAVNGFELAMRLGPEGFEHLIATGSAHLDHPDRAIRLLDGSISIDYDRASDRLTYRGTAGRVSVRDGDFSIRPEKVGSQVSLGDSFRGRIAGSVFELRVRGATMESLRFDSATADIQVFDSSTDASHSLSLTDQTLTLFPGADGSTRMNLGLDDSRGGPGANSFGFSGTQVTLEGSTSITAHLTTGGRLAEGDGLVALMPGTIRITHDERGLRGTLTGTSSEAGHSQLRFGIENGVVIWAEGQARAEGFHLLATEERIGFHVDRGARLQDTRELFDPETSDLYGDVTHLDVFFSTSESGDPPDVHRGDALLRFEELQISVDLAKRHPLAVLGTRLHFDTQTVAQGLLDRVFLDVPARGRVEVLQRDMHAALVEQSRALEQNDDGSIALDAIGVSTDVHARAASVAAGVFRATFDPKRGVLFDNIQNTRVIVESADGHELDMNSLIERMRDVAHELFSIDGALQEEAFMLTPSLDASLVDASFRFESRGISFRVDAEGACDIEALAAVDVDRIVAYVIDPAASGDIPSDSRPLPAEGFLGRLVPFDPMQVLVGVQQMASTDGASLGGVFRYEPDGVLRIGTLDPSSSISSSLRLALPGEAWRPTEFGFNAAVVPIDGTPSFALSLGSQRRMNHDGTWRVAPHPGLSLGSDLEVERFRSRLGAHGTLPGFAAAFGSEDYVSDPVLRGACVALGYQWGPRDKSVKPVGGLLLDHHRNGDNTLATGTQLSLSTDRLARGVQRLFGSR